MKPHVRVGLVIAIIVSSAISAMGMAPHNGAVLDEGNRITCVASIASDWEAGTYREVTVWLYGPSEEFLDASAIGNFDGKHTLAEAAHEYVGPGTYTCDAEFYEDIQWPGSPEWDYGHYEAYIEH